MSRSLHPPCQNHELIEFSLVYHTDGLKNILLFRGCVLRATSSLVRGGKCIFHGRSGSEAPPVAQVQLAFQLMHLNDLLRQAGIWNFRVGGHSWNCVPRWPKPHISCLTPFYTFSHKSCHLCFLNIFHILPTFLNSDFCHLSPISLVS